ncbi:C-factor-like [Colossoma macropomum]|uniref:C-factor-like n=1 Tax=Colossoma macropomum TaxID=42526 RepID=UPI001864D4C8|nr:C-factor-like [Colossoma macropomum]
MAGTKACSILITGANRGLGLEMVRQLVEGPCTAQKIFAGCHSPQGPQSKALQDLAEKYPDIITVVPLDTTDPSSIKESAKMVGSQVGDKGLNVLVNNAGVLAHGKMQDTSADDMLCAFTTNVIGPMSVTKEYLPYLRVAARSSGEPGMSCCKAAVINISSRLGSMSSIPQLYSIFPAFSYSISKAGLNMLTVYAALELRKDEILCTALHPGWVRTDTGGEQASMEAKQSVEALLKVMSSLNEQHHGGFLDYAGNTVPW